MHQNAIGCGRVLQNGLRCASILPLTACPAYFTAVTVQSLGQHCSPSRAFPSILGAPTSTGGLTSSLPQLSQKISSGNSVISSFRFKSDGPLAPLLLEQLEAIINCSIFNIVIFQGPEEREIQGNGWPMKYSEHKTFVNFSCHLI